MSLFERYLTVWVGLCMVVGVLLGRTLPGLTESLRGLEFGAGSQINAPIAVLIWLMIVPMMMKIDFSSLAGATRKPKGLAVTLFVNWLVKPFSMFALGWLFFQVSVSASYRGGVGEAVHRRGHHPRRRPLHGDGIRVELPD